MTGRTRERVVDTEGRERTMQKPPRADLITYPSGWVTVLVRRTHDVALAWALAEELWNRSAPAGAPPLGTHSRIGWWTTVARRPRSGDAHDEQGRVVTWIEDSTATGAGAGVEFRPDQKPRSP